MSDEYESINSKMPDLETVLIQRISQKQASTNNQFDPYQAMIKKKEAENIPVDPTTIKQWPEEDVKRLQDYCQKMGIVGVNNARMPPVVMLALLKRQFGEDFTGIPLEERLPVGYQKINSDKKQVIYG